MCDFNLYKETKKIVPAIFKKNEPKEKEMRLLMTCYAFLKESDNPDRDMRIISRYVHKGDIVGFNSLFLRPAKKSVAKMFYSENIFNTETDSYTFFAMFEPYLNQLFCYMRACTLKNVPSGRMEGQPMVI